MLDCLVKLKLVLGKQSKKFVDPINPRGKRDILPSCGSVKKKKKYIYIYIYIYILFKIIKIILGKKEEKKRKPNRSLSVMVILGSNN